MELFIPWRDGFELGRGFNSLTGEVRGVAAEGEVRTSDLSGQFVRSNATIVTTQEQMFETLKISVEAGGRYGMFSGEGRFGLAQESGFTSQSTYVVAKCVVVNAFRSFAQARPSAAAAQRMKDDGPAAFAAGFGNGYFNGVRSGGELYVVYQLTSKSTTEQMNVAASLQASVQALFAGGSIESSVESLKQSKSRVDSVSVMFYQRAGKDQSIQPVSTPEDTAARLKNFPAIANADAVGYQAQILDYQVLNLPPFDELGASQRQEALEDYARLKLKYLGFRAEIELVRRNPDLFEGSYDDGQLGKDSDLYTQAVNELMRHARRVKDKEIEPSLFNPATVDGLGRCEFMRSKRKRPTRTSWRCRR